MLDALPNVPLTTGERRSAISRSWFPLPLWKIFYRRPCSHGQGGRGGQCGQGGRGTNFSRFCADVFMNASLCVWFVWQTQNSMVHTREAGSTCQFMSPV